MAYGGYATEMWYTFFQVSSGTFWLVRQRCYEMIYSHTPSYRVSVSMISCIVLLFGLCYTDAVQEVELCIRVGCSRWLRLLTASAVLK